MKHGQTLSSLTARVIEGIDPILAEEKPDLVLEGDDTTTLLRSCCFRLISHIKARLRTEKVFPVAEEINHN